MKSIIRATKLLLTMAIAMTLSGCEPPAVYASVGVFSYSRYGYGGARVRTSMTMGGRIY